MNIPEDLRYSREHEWVRLDGTVARVGITDFAQDSLGDVVFVQLPDVGLDVVAGASVSEIESTKSVSDVYVPLTGKVSAVNDALGDAPELVNSGPVRHGLDVRDRRRRSGRGRRAARRGRVPRAHRGLSPRAHGLVALQLSTFTLWLRSSRRCRLRAAPIA